MSYFTPLSLYYFNNASKVLFMSNKEALAFICTNSGCVWNKCTVINYFLPTVSIDTGVIERFYKHDCISLKLSQYCFWSLYNFKLN